AARQLETALEQDGLGEDARTSALKASQEATLALEEGMGFAIDVLVGQARSIATDLLRALGVEDAVGQIRAAAS
ncbi:MAG TPA: hypothetical protein VG652_08075, partial [Gaiellaceae bacterium]|nr:hypothetical protein [Gaiellaceae bacterium]